MQNIPEESEKSDKPPQSEQLIRELPLIRRYARENVGEDAQFRTFLKNRLPLSNEALDVIVQETTDNVWAQIDCTTCGNCCRTFEITIDNEDIARLAARLGVSVRAFVKQYVAVEPDKTQHFSLSPCPFLGDDNRCMVYEDRPTSCRDFPHLHSGNFRQRAATMLDNSEDCPIIFNVWQRLKRRLWRERKRKSRSTTE